MTLLHLADNCSLGPTTPCHPAGLASERYRIVAARSRRDAQRGGALRVSGPREPPLPARRDAEWANPSSARRRSCLREILLLVLLPGEPVVRAGRSRAAFADPWLPASCLGPNTGRGSWSPVDVERSRVRWPSWEQPAARARADGDCAPHRTPCWHQRRPPLAKELPAVARLLHRGREAPRSRPGRVSCAYCRHPGRRTALVPRSRRGSREHSPFQSKSPSPPAHGPLRRRVLYLRLQLQVPRRPWGGRVALASPASAYPAFPRSSFRVGLARKRNAESFGVPARCSPTRSSVRASGPHGRRRAADAVAARFAEHGVEIDAPYLEPSLAGRHVL